jgi:uncharacterized protein YbjT (DUF2867 family)
MTPILVTGGTGTLGRLVVGRLRDAGQPVRVLTRQTRPSEPGVTFLTGDLATGSGLEHAVADTRAIIHCASAKKGDAETTLNLVRAASSLPAPPHLVYISIVGVDRLTFGYTRTKLQSELIVANSGLPWTILRATQFYDLILSGTKRLARLPIVPVPARFDVQPVHTDEVAARLAALAAEEPAGRVPDIAGPERLSFADIARAYLRAIGRHRPVVEVWLPGTRKIREGALVPDRHNAPGLITGRRTWQEFLTDTLERRGQAIAPG